MRLPLPAIASVRDFYAFEQHVATCRRQRGLDMVPQWYEVPVFYFSNPAGVIFHEAEVWAPRDSQALDYELELACVIGKEARDLPDDDRALEAVAGLHDHERLERSRPSAHRDGRRPGAQQRERLRDLARARAGNLRRAGGLLSRRPAPPGNDRHGQWPLVIARKLGFDVLDVAAVAGPCQPRHQLRPGDVLGSGTVGSGCILELTPEVAGGWLKPGDLVELAIDRLGTLRNRVVPHP